MEIDLEEVRFCKPSRRAVRNAKDDDEEEMEDDNGGFRRRRFKGRRGGKGKKGGKLTEEQADSIPREEDNFRGKCVMCPEPEVPVADDENNETEDF